MKGRQSMPYTMHSGPCKKCGATNTIFREKWSVQNQKFYVQPKCKSCENEGSRNYQKENLDKYREANKRAYLKKLANRPPRKTGRTEEEKRLYYLQKAYRRHAYVKQAAFSDELTTLVFKEALRLVKMRDALTGVKWSVDHTIPFKGHHICGLHIWSNIQVISLSENLKKGNNYALHTA